MFLFSQHTTHALGLSHSLPVRFVSLLFVFLCILQLFFPVLLQYRWVCFAWRMHDNTIVVYDPCINFLWACCEAIKICNDASIYHNTPRLALWLGRRPLRGFPWPRLHSYMVSMSRAAPFFFLCNSHLFLSTSYLTKFPYHICSNHSPNRTGLLCLHFCRCFNGQQLLPPLDAVLIKNIPFAFAMSIIIYWTMAHVFQFFQ